MWRAPTAGILSVLSPRDRVTFNDYALTVAAVVASGGTSDPTGGGGGAAGTKAPSLVRVIAAERLRKYHIAFEGKAFTSR
ncbi:hypothetical protein ACMA5I_00145 [Paracoccaceae bacterium GXU_MW_L88]